MTQEELAEKCGTATNYIGCIEIGTKTPSFKLIEKIAMALGVDEMDLLREHSTEEPNNRVGEVTSTPLSNKTFENVLLSNISNAVKKTLEGWK